jgi:hypothetical protein
MPSSHCRRRINILWPAICVTSLLASRVTAEEPIVFNRDIRPILSENCFFCHGPDASKREADLRLDARVDAVAGAIIPGPTPTK